MAKNTTYRVYDAELNYSQVFERNKDKGGDDNDAARTIAAKGGQTKVTMVVTEGVKEQMVADGIPEKSLGHDMFKPNGDGRWVYIAKRPWNSPFKDEETGEMKPFGAPNVVEMKQEGDEITITPWDEEVNIGNGSKGKVKMSIWSSGSKRIVRLESVAVTELVPYEANGEAHW